MDEQPHRLLGGNSENEITGVHRDRLPLEIDIFSSLSYVPLTRPSRLSALERVQSLSSEVDHFLSLCVSLTRSHGRDDCPPVGVEALYIVLPALVAVKSYESLIDLRK